MALGNKNRIVLQITAFDETNFDAQIVGDGTNNDCGNHVRLPCKAQLEKVVVMCNSMAAVKTGTIKIYEGTSSSGTEVASASIATATPSATATIVAAQKDKVYAEDTEFCLAENCSAGANALGLCAILTFREMQA